MAALTELDPLVVQQEMNSNPCVQQVAAAGAAADTVCTELNAGSLECRESRAQAASLENDCINHGWATFTQENADGSVSFASLVPALQSACETEGGDYYYKPEHCIPIPDTTELPPQPTLPQPEGEAVNPAAEVVEEYGGEKGGGYQPMP